MRPTFIVRWLYQSCGVIRKGACCVPSLWLYTERCMLCSQSMTLYRKVHMFPILWPYTERCMLFPLSVTLHRKVHVVFPVYDFTQKGACCVPSLTLYRKVYMFPILWPYTERCILCSQLVWLYTERCILCSQLVWLYTERCMLCSQLVWLYTERCWKPVFAAGKYRRCRSTFKHNVFVCQCHQKLQVLVSYTWLTTNFLYSQMTGCHTKMGYIGK